MKPHVLIVTAAHLCRSPRAVKEAAALARAGHRVTLVSASYTAPLDALDDELCRSLPIDRRVLRFHGTGWRTRFARLVRRVQTRAACIAVARFGVETGWALGPVGELFRVVAREPADLTILHQEAPLCLASKLIQRGRRVAVDFEDWYSEDLLPADRRSRPLRLLRTAEAAALRQAAYSSAPSASMATALAARYDAPAPRVIRNTFPLPSRFNGGRGTNGTEPSFVWFSQTIGPGRGVEFFLAGWSQMRTPTRLVLIGEPRAGYPAELLACVPETRRASVQFLPFVPPGALAEKLSEFDVGLALEPIEPPNKDLTISNKILQYLGAGLAIVATDTRGQREVINQAPEAGLLVSRDDEATLAGQLDTLVHDRNALRARQAASRRAAEAMFDWDRHDGPRLLAAVEQALS